MAACRRAPFGVTASPYGLSPTDAVPTTAFAKGSTTETVVPPVATYRNETSRESETSRNEPGFDVSSTTSVANAPRVTGMFHSLWSWLKSLGRRSSTPSRGTRPPGHRDDPSAAPFATCRVNGPIEPAVEIVREKRFGEPVDLVNRS